MSNDRYLGYGDLAVDALKRVNDVASYQYEVAKFNLEHHHYNDCDVLTYKLDESTLDFTKDYLENWFSDYVYIKNITKEEVTIKTEERDEITGKTIGEKDVVLKPNAIAILSFGRLIKIIEGE